MSEVIYYKRELKDIIVSIPASTVEMTIKLKMYEDGELVDAEQVFALNDIRYAEDLFKQCCDGEYPRYTLTEKGREYVEMIGGNMAKDNNKKENPAKNVKTTPLPVKEARYGFYKRKGRIKGE